MKIYFLSIVEVKNQERGFKGSIGQVLVLMNQYLSSYILHEFMQ